MTSSDWVTIWGIAIGVFVSMAGGVWYLASSIGDLKVGIGELRGSIAEVRGELKGSIAEVRAELKGSIAEVTGELRGSIAEVRAELKESIAGVRAELRESIAEVTGELRGSIAEVRAELKEGIALTRAELRESIAEVRGEMREMNIKLDILWREHLANSNSPITLNEMGVRILEKSNIGAFAEEHFDETVAKVRKFKPENAYQAQELLISILGSYIKEDEHRLNLQQISFDSGYDVSSLLFVAALSIRDRVIAKLGFGDIAH